MERTQKLEDMAKALEEYDGVVGDLEKQLSRAETERNNFRDSLIRDWYPEALQKDGGKVVYVTGCGTLVFVMVGETQYLESGDVSRVMVPRVSFLNEKGEGNA